MNWIPSISSSTPDGIDLFCGYGGLSTAMGVLGIWVKKALNHNADSIYVHQLNHPYTDHHLSDVKKVHPREHPHTALFAGSAACTDFSQADPENIKTLMRQQLALFDDNMDPVDYEMQYEEFVAQHQGRATMFDVLRWVAFHKYHYGITENVVQVHKWALFPKWCRDLRNMGYNYKFLYLNAMFMHDLNGVQDLPYAPQSRDRWICVFWRKGNPAPNLDFRPLAPCPVCGDVRAIQVWKNPAKQWGIYGFDHGQYYYGCPNCLEKYSSKGGWRPASKNQYTLPGVDPDTGNYLVADGVRPLPVHPYYYAGINAVDWTIPMQTIGDPNRRNKVSEKTKVRVGIGMERFGYEPLILDIQRTEDGHIKHRSAILSPLFSQTGSATQTICIPPIYLTDAAKGGHLKGIFAPLFAQTTADTQGLATTPFLVTLGGSNESRPAIEPLNTQTTLGSKNGFALIPAFLLELYGGGAGRHPAEAINTVTAGVPKTGLVTPAFMVERTGPEHSVDRDRLRQITEPVNTQTAGGARTGLAVPFFVSYNGHSVIQSGDEAISAMTTKIRHGMTWPKPTVEECYYRTFRAKVIKKGDHGSKYLTSEIGAAQGFPQGPDGYKVDVTHSTDKITYGYGNAVPPAMAYWPLKQIMKVMVT